MGVVDYSFYQTVYKGEDADEASFPALCARAEDVIEMIVRYPFGETFQSLQPSRQTLYKKAVCAQIDYLAINGADSLNEGSSTGFTVGKVSVSGKAGYKGNSLIQHVSALAFAYLQQAGLMNTQVPCFDGWW